MADPKLADSNPILLVEDDPGDAARILAVLEGSGLADAVILCRDGAEALEYLCRRGPHARREARDPAVMLLDLTLPGIDGLEVLAAVKSDPLLRVTPVVMLTASPAESERVRAYELDVNAFLVKPVEPEAVRAALRDLGVLGPVPSARRRAFSAA